MSLPLHSSALVPAGADPLMAPGAMSSGSASVVKTEVSPSAAASRDFEKAMEVARAQAVGPDQATVAHARAHPETGLGGQVVSKVQSLSEKLRSEQKHISNLVEQATATGDQSLITKAQLALADHQSRVQIITRVTSKAASSMDQLTRLQ
jgi:Type III secretion basal body protein I, YscI, HrpB, PscI